MMETNETNHAKRDIIIIEDSLTVATLLRDFLNKLGYPNIHTCENGASGIRVFEDIVQAGKMPLVFLDYSLPDMKGDEVMEKILSISPDTKIILETASEKDEEEIKDAIRHGIYDYLGKPIRFENVKNIMDTFEKEYAILQQPEPATQKQIESLVAKPTPTLNLKKLTTVILTASVIAVVFLGLYAYQIFTTPSILTTPLNTGRYVVENLKGDVIDTWTAWRLPEGETLHVIIVNSEIVSDDKINSIKNAILSQETVTLENSLVGKSPQGVSSVYYKGWKSALEKAGENDVAFYIPTNIDVTKGEKAIGEITIILSELQEVKINTFPPTHIMSLSELNTIRLIQDKDGNTVAHPSILYSSFRDDDNLRYHVVSPDGTCVIGSSAKCHVKYSTSGQRGHMVSVTIGDQIYRVKYSGPNAALERFIITSTDPIVGRWDVKIETGSGMIQRDIMKDVSLKIKYLPEKIPFVLSFSE